MDCPYCGMPYDLCECGASRVAEAHSMGGWDLSGEDRNLVLAIAELEGIDAEQLLAAAEEL